MHRFILLALLFLLKPHDGYSGQIVMETDIARWYLDADVVIVCVTNQTDTLYLSKYDSTTSDSVRTSYEIVREKYSITVDSMIKNDGSIKEISCIFSPEITINYGRIKYLGFYGLSENGDSIFTAQSVVECCFGNDGYNQLKLNKKQVVFLSKTDYGYTVDYQCNYDEYIINLINKVQEKGQSFIDDYGKFPDNR